MKKIPTLFTRIYENHKVIGIKDEIAHGCDPDPITGHWPHWVEVDPSNPNDKWFVEAFNNSRKMGMELENGTYEAIGPHFQGNPYKLDHDILVKHGAMVVDVKRDFESISQWLNNNDVEGLVFWLDGESVCKIKRSDFGYEWPVKDT